MWLQLVQMRIVVMVVQYALEIGTVEHVSTEHRYIRIGIERCTFFSTCAKSLNLTANYTTHALLAVPLLTDGSSSDTRAIGIDYHSIITPGSRCVYLMSSANTCIYRYIWHASRTEWTRLIYLSNRQPIFGREEKSKKSYNNTRCDEQRYIKGKLKEQPANSTIKRCSSSSDNLTHVRVSRLSEAKARVQAARTRWREAAAATRRSSRWTFVSCEARAWLPPASVRWGPRTRLAHRAGPFARAREIERLSARDIYICSYCIGNVAVLSIALYNWSLIFDRMGCEGAFAQSYVDVLVIFQVLHQVNPSVNRIIIRRCPGMSQHTVKARRTSISITHLYSGEIGMCICMREGEAPRGAWLCIYIYIQLAF